MSKLEAITEVLGVTVLDDDEVKAIKSEAEHDDVLDGLMTLIELQRTVKKVLAEYKGECVKWCEANERELRVSKDRWFSVKDEKKVTCKDPAKALEIILDLTGGSFDSMVEALGSNAIKHGWFRKFIKQHYLEHPDDADKVFKQLFDTTWKPALDEHGKPKLAETDLTFVR